MAERSAIQLGRLRKSKLEGLLILALSMIFLSSKTEAQLSTMYGNVGFGYEYENQQFENASTSRQLFLQQYNLGVEGRILDPRLAVFSLASDFNTNLLLQQNSRASSFTGTLSLLQAAPYGLTLRAGRSFGSGGSDTEGSTLGANLRFTMPDWPQTFVDFDRVAIESRGDTRSDTSITTGRVRFSHRLWNTMFDGELGIQSFADQIADTTQDRYFGRLNGTLTWSPTTLLRSVSDFFSQGNQLALGSSYTLENRPDPTLSRTLGLSYRSNEAADQTDHALNLTGAISKTFVPYAWLQANAFSSAVAQRNFGVDNSSVGFAWSGGGSAAVSYFRPATLLSDYALAVSHQSEIGRVSTTQQAHFGAVSRTLDPLRLSGDYYFGYQTGLTRGIRQFVAGRAETALTPGVTLRSFADFLTENTTSEDSEGASNERTTTNVGAGVSYRPLFNLNLDLAGNVQWNASRDDSDTIMRLNLLVSYRIPTAGTPSLDINARWERSTLNDDSMLEVRSRLNYRIGQATLALEHRFDRRATLHSTGLTNAIRFTFTRPFRISFSR